MSKAVMISIQPKWCELIASGKKTIEVRKTAPKIDTPFKCYIYEAKNTKGVHGFTILGRYRLGKVVGEFVCDKIDNILYDDRECTNPPLEEVLEKSCLSYKELCEYGNYKDLYGLHISDLKIYDKPKELGEFSPPCNLDTCMGCKFFSNGASNHSGSERQLRTLGIFGRKDIMANQLLIGYKHKY